MHCVCLSITDTAERDSGSGGGTVRGSRLNGELGSIEELVRSFQGCLTATTGWRGSVVRVLLPATERSGEGARRESRRETSGDGIPVLVAEKDEIVRETATEILEHYGFRVASAATIEETMAILDHERFGALVLDLSLARTGPEELLDVFLERWEDLSVLLSSGFELPAGLKARTALKRVSFLKKPFFPEALASELVRLVGAEHGKSSRESGRPRTGDRGSQ